MVRLDKLLQDRFPALTRTKIQDLIKRGLVQVNGKIVTKPGISIGEDANLDLHDDQKFVSRAGVKLEAALDYFSIDVQGKVCLDGGISTGGFTDCLIRRGAKHVYGVDVGQGQLHPVLQNNHHLTLLEKTNLKNLFLSELVDLVTLDLSFISCTHVFDNLLTLIKNNAELIILIKPQFELSPQEIGKGGLVKDPVLHQKAVKRVVDYLEKLQLKVIGVIDSPILGSTGNKEFLCYAIK
jgi:23S rRNA (cytidine1920-2'-O)/16S rRNA (cytidine1409-2'-O)-methyltransferase